MKPDDLFAEFTVGFSGRKFSAGLLIAFIDMLLSLDTPSSGFAGFDAFLAVHPQQTVTAAGKHANTLIVKTDTGTISLRPFYNEIERDFRARHKRFDYPSCAPHATQAWGDYRKWLDALCTYSIEQLNDLRKRVHQFVLDVLVSQDFDPATVQVEPPLFRRVLESFELTAQKGEPSGAAFQGIVFGFLRADNPHLQVEIRKVRTGSKIAHGVADIDGWDGKRLAISAEVKQYGISLDSVPDLEGFANEVGRRGALGLVTALSFDEGVRGAIEDLGLRPLDLDDLLRVVELWDPLKQRTAVSSLLYYATHIEQNSALIARLTAFLETASKPAPPPEIAS